MCPKLSDQSNDDPVRHYVKTTNTDANSHDEKQVLRIFVVSMLLLKSRR